MQRFQLWASDFVSGIVPLVFLEVGWSISLMTRVPFGHIPCRYRLARCSYPAVDHGLGKHRIFWFCSSPALPQLAGFAVVQPHFRDLLFCAKHLFSMAPIDPARGAQR